MFLCVSDCVCVCRHRLVSVCEIRGRNTDRTGTLTHVDVCVHALAFVFTFISMHEYSMCVFCALKLHLHIHLFVHLFLKLHLWLHCMLVWDSFFSTDTYNLFNDCIWGADIRTCAFVPLNKNIKVAEGFYFEGLLVRDSV